MWDICRRGLYSQVLNSESVEIREGINFSRSAIIIYFYFYFTVIS
jgi:hypothetical protein